MDRAVLWNALRSDRVMQLAGAVFAALALPYFVPLVSFETLANVAWYFTDPILLTFTLALVLHRRRQTRTLSGRRFWTYLSLALGFWLASACYSIVVPELRTTKMTSLIVDGLYAIFYVFLILATELRPDLSPRLVPRRGEEKLTLATSILFLFAMAIYFSGLPTMLPEELYNQERLSLVLYLYLDSFICARFAYLAGVTPSERWSWTYRFFFAAFGITAMLDLLQLSATSPSSIIPPDYGTPWDLLWFLPFALILCAARTDAVLRLDAGRGTALGDRRRLAQVLSRPRVWEPLVFYAMAFPLLHLLLDFYGLLPPQLRSSQQGLVIVYFACFGTLALVQTLQRDQRRRTVERQLRDSEQHYRRLIEDSPDAILIEQKRLVVYANNAGLNLFGREKLVRRPTLAALGLPTEPGEPSSSRLLSADPQEHRIPVEHEITEPDGTTRSLEITFFDVHHQGRPAREIIVRDVTAVKKIRDENERLERLASLGKFSAAMAHEIRNPLAAIVMQSFFLSRHLPKSDENLEILADLSSAVERMQHVVDGVLSFVRPQPMRMDEEDLVDVVRSSLYEIRTRTNGTQIEVQESYTHHDARIRVDSGQLQVALSNILNNAVRAMPQGGLLRIRTKDAGNAVQLSIEDSGDGIRPEDLEHIFEPFFTRRDDGAGLGLALVARIFEHHEITYRVESILGQGTRFVMRFPLFAPRRDPSPSREERAAERSSPGRAARILPPLDGAYEDSIRLEETVVHDVVPAAEEVA